MLTASQLHTLTRDQFLTKFAGIAEASPWVAERVWAHAPFHDRAALETAFEHELTRMSEVDAVKLIQAHPDLVGRAALAGTLSSESTQEQASAGLNRLSPDEINDFQALNAAYQARFGFPFVICVRENRKQAILEGMQTRLKSSRDAEIETAIGEIVKIVKLRLADRVAA